MFLEYKLRAAMAFMQQTVTIGGVARSAGTTSRRLKSALTAAYKVDFEMPSSSRHPLVSVGLTPAPLVFPQYRLMDSKFVASYSPSVQTGEFVSEKTMFMNCELTVRARRPYTGYNMSQWKQLTEVKECLSKFNGVIGSSAILCHGTAELWGYVPICRSDRDRLSTISCNNEAPEMARFFNGYDIPSTCYAAIGNYSFLGDSGIGYLNKSENLGGFSIQTIGTLNQHPIDSTGQAARMALGISIESDNDWYNTSCGRANPGRITAGPLTDNLVLEARTIAEQSGENNIWEDYDLEVLEVTEADDDRFYFEEDEEDEEDDDR